MAPAAVDAANLSLRAGERETLEIWPETNETVRTEGESSGSVGHHSGALVEPQYIHLFYVSFCSTLLPKMLLPFNTYIL